MFRRSSAVVATKQAGHRLPRLGPGNPALGTLEPPQCLRLMSIKIPVNFVLLSSPVAGMLFASLPRDLKSTIS
jgi:hypothetical protein